MTQQEIEQLMDRYSVYLLKLAYVYVNDRQIAEDIVQEVFIQLYERSQYDERGKMKSYLTILVVNRCKNYLKSWSYRMLQLKDSFIEKTHVTKDALIVADERQLIGQAIFALPFKYREVLFFHYYEDMKVADIAATLTIPESTVKTRLVKARQLLKQTLPNTSWEVLVNE